MEKWYPLNIPDWQTEITYKRQRWSYCFNIKDYELLCPASVLGKYWVLSEIASRFTTWKEIWRFYWHKQRKINWKHVQATITTSVTHGIFHCYIERKSLCGVCSASATLCAEEPTVIKATYVTRKSCGSVVRASNWHYRGCHLWVEFVGSLLTALRGFLLVLRFPLSSKTSIWLD